MKHWNGAAKKVRKSFCLKGLLFLNEPSNSITLTRGQQNVFSAWSALRRRYYYAGGLARQTAGDFFRGKKTSPGISSSLKIIKNFLKFYPPTRRIYCLWFVWLENQSIVMSKIRKEGKLETLPKDWNAAHFRFIEEVWRVFHWLFVFSLIE